ncbi:hypothetical protein C8F01DRAFT_998440 [Mycena amicta]|nr:hypothetical protein C8F01DRAFT_998440 [Mycena amicta]
MDLDEDLSVNRPPPSPPPSPRDERASVEEVPDADDDEDLDVAGSSRWREDYPKPAGCVLDDGAQGQTRFEAFRQQQKELGLEACAPFDDDGDWELAEWLVEAGVSRNKIDSFLKLDKIRNGAKPSYHSAYTFFKKIDSLPSGPKWECELITITGDTKDEAGKPRTEEIEFWRRDAVECLEEIMGNPAFKKHMRYAPQHVYRNGPGDNREYSEMYTADLWWNGLIPVGHTVCPVIIGTDETQLSSFSGDKKAWPVYLTTGNIDFDVRRKPNMHATILIGYIPVSKFSCFSKSKRSGVRYQLFHDCMRKLLTGMEEAGRDGKRMLCADKHFRTNHPILAAYLADHPERCLASCCAQNRCTECKVHEDKRGDPIHSAPRDPEEAIRILQQQANGLKPREFDELGLKLTDPFWKHLPHCNIYRCFQCDLLHQLHKGAFNDHTVPWATDSFGGSDNENNAEIDKRFQAMPSHPSLRNFRQGISLVSQWTGNEYKNMEKVFLGVINGIGEPRVLLAVRGILDFIYYAHFETHTDKSLQRLTAAWLMFHDNKKVFLDTGIREHFNIPKIHAMMHYVELIRLGGSASGFSTELTERMHIDCAKLGYRASNRKNYISQMTRWLTRRESMWRFSAYLQWVQSNSARPTKRHDHPEDEEDDEDDEDDEDELVVGELDESQGVDVAADVLPPPFKVAKTAPFKLSARKMEAEFGASDFLIHLKNFLRSHLSIPPDFDSISADFPVYKRVTISIPPVIQVSRLPISDPIRATRAIPARGLKKESPAHFDTILARKNTPASIPKRLSLEGLFPGRIRAIFALPIEYGRFETPLAYIEWYKPLTTRDDTLGMFKISAATQNNRRRASIIPVTLINRSCHLIPRFPRQIDRTLTSDNVLDRAKNFYLNPYLRHIDFVLLRDAE